MPLPECHICGRTWDTEEDGWVIFFDKKSQRRWDRRVWWECPDHRPNYEQLQLWGQDAPREETIEQG